MLVAVSPQLVLSTRSGFLGYWHKRLPKEDTGYLLIRLIPAKTAFQCGMCFFFFLTVFISVSPIFMEWWFW